MGSRNLSPRQPSPVSAVLPWAVSGVTKALAATDPDRAERIARSITTGYEKTSALTGVAEALAAAEPDRAAWLFRDAERNYLWPNKATALGSIAVALVAISS